MVRKMVSLFAVVRHATTFFNIGVRTRTYVPNTLSERERASAPYRSPKNIWARYFCAITPKMVFSDRSH